MAYAATGDVTLIVAAFETTESWGEKPCAAGARLKRNSGHDL